MINRNTVCEKFKVDPVPNNQEEERKHPAQALSSLLPKERNGIDSKEKEEDNEQRGLGIGNRPQGLML
jgi:hypothetical protein